MWEQLALPHRLTAADACEAGRAKDGDDTWTTAALVDDQTVDAILN